jgi:hypothetical protein
MYIRIRTGIEIRELKHTTPGINYLAFLAEIGREMHMKVEKQGFGDG